MITRASEIGLLLAPYASDIMALALLGIDSRLKASAREVNWLDAFKRVQVDCNTINQQHLARWKKISILTEGKYRSLRVATLNGAAAIPFVSRDPGIAITMMLLVSVCGYLDQRTWVSATVDNVDAVVKQSRWIAVATIVLVLLLKVVVLYPGGTETGVTSET